MYFCALSFLEKLEKKEYECYGKEIESCSTL